MLKVISVVEVISIIQLYILLCLPNKMATILQENEFYFAAAALVAVTAAAVIV